MRFGKIDRLMGDCHYNKIILLLYLTGRKSKTEIYNSISTNPRMPQKLAFLEESGLVVCPADTLPQAILGCHTGKPCQHAAEETVAIDKRVVSERDVASLYKQGLACIRVGERSIVTDLAREYAAARGVKIVRS